MDYRLTALATLAMVATYVWTGLMVGQARGKHKVKAPATEGPDDFNRVPDEPLLRVVRVHRKILGHALVIRAETPAPELAF